MRALTYGSSTRPPLVLLHGFTGSPASWRRVIAQLGDAYHIHCPYLPGHHPHEESCIPFEAAVTQLGALLRSLPAPATLLGYSLGGRLALATALGFPGAVERLVLESATPGIADAGERTARRTADDQLAGHLRQRGLAWFVDYWEKQPIFASQTRLPDEVLAEQRTVRLQHQVEGLAQSLEKMGTGVMEPMWAQLHTLRLPVTLITGALDTRYETLAKAMAADLRQARHIVIHDAGHATHLEEPERFVSAAFG